MPREAGPQWQVGPGGHSWPLTTPRFLSSGAGLPVRKGREAEQRRRTVTSEWLGADKPSERPVHQALLYVPGPAGVGEGRGALAQLRRGARGPPPALCPASRCAHRMAQPPRKLEGGRGEMREWAASQAAVTGQEPRGRGLNWEGARRTRQEHLCRGQRHGWR